MAAKGSELKDKASRFYGLARYSVPAFILLGIIAICLAGVTILYVISGKNQHINPTILVPLYLDPGNNGTNWEPLFNAIRTYPRVNFVLAINPNNGPDTKKSPDPNYKSGLNILKNLTSTTKSNVKVIGYVHQSYGNRSIADVTADITTWSTWSRTDLYNYTLDGIFFDESPHENNPGNLTYINTVTEFTKSASLTGFKTPPSSSAVFTVQNPGSIPPKSHLALHSITDATIILEGPLSTFRTNRVATYDNLAEDDDTLIKKLSIVLYDVPVGLSDKEWQNAVSLVATDAGYIFMTDQTAEDAYSKFGDGWMSFVKAVAAT